jgi:hypothetical protein
VLKDGAGKIGVVVPEDSFVSGANRVQVFSVLERDGAVALAPSGVAAAPSYSLDSQDETITLVSSNGERIPVVPGAVSGGLDSVYERNESIAILGWAADVKGKRPCVRVVLFLEGDFLTSTSTFTARPGVGKHLKIPSLVDVGVSIDLPRSISGYARGARYRMFAISSSGNASELRGFTIP